MLTAIVMFRGEDAETFVQIVEGRLTAEQRRKWRDNHDCDMPGDEDKDDKNNMFFREFEKPLSNSKTSDLWNANDETTAPASGELPAPIKND